MNIQSFLKKSIIWFCAALIPLTLGGNAIIVKKAVNDGMKFSVFLFYKNFIAALALLPYVIIRRNSLPNMTKKIFAHIMLLTILEPVMDQNFLYAGLKFTPATLSSCASALVPALTFIGSWMFGLEDVHITERRSQAKLLGTTVMTVGAIIAGVYAGPSIVILNSDQNETIGQNLKENWVRGPALIFASLVSAVSYNIVLGKTLNHYPAPLAVTGYVCMLGAPLNMIIAVGLEGRSRFSWLIIFDERLLAYLYGGIVVSCLTSYLQGRLTKVRGPVFFTAFSPLSMIFVTLVATFALKENLVLGRIMGVCFLLCGLSLLLWGKSSQETEGEDEHVDVIIESPVVTAAKAEEDVVVQYDEPAPVETATEAEEDVIVQSDEPAEVDLHVGQSRSEPLQTSYKSTHVLRRCRTI